MEYERISFFLFLFPFSFGLKNKSKEKEKSNAQSANVLEQVDFLGDWNYCGLYFRVNRPF